MGLPFASFVFGIASHKVADAVRTASRLAVPFEDLPEGRTTGPVRKRPWWPTLRRNAPGRCSPNCLITYVSC